MYPILSPIISDWIEDILKNKTELKKAVKRYGSPLNIHNPELLEKNIAEFDTTLKKYLHRYKVFFARKPNNALGYVQKALAMNIGVDVASLPELKQVLYLRPKKENIIVTAVVKNRDLIAAIVKNKILTTIDNFDELNAISDEARKRQNIVPIAIRVGGFRFNGDKSYTRFGFDVDQLKSVFVELRKPKNSYLNFQGFHFHLNGYSLDERALAISQLIDIARKIKQLGFITEFIDVGGGFLVNYLRSRKEWNTFHAELKKAVLGLRTPITHQNNGLCYIKYKGEIVNLNNLYPYFNEYPKAQGLERVLKTKIGIETISDKLNEAEIELRIEPGRSSLDQCGVTVAEVVYTKKDINDDLLVGLHMNFTQLFSSSIEFAVDPTVIYFDELVKTSAQNGFLVGTYCMERDIIQKRKFRFRQTPKSGDLVCFINTAGYMMHFLASQSHQFPKAKNVIATKKGNNFKFIPDPIEMVN